MRTIREAPRMHIHRATDGYFLHPRDGFAKNFSGFDSDMDRMATGARERGHYEILKPGLEYLLAHPELDLESYWSSESWVWDDEEVRAVLIYLRDRLRPDAGPVPEGGGARR